MDKTKTLDYRTEEYNRHKEVTPILDILDSDDVYLTSGLRDAISVTRDSNIS